jgi:hypothetical protein
VTASGHIQGLSVEAKQIGVVLDGGGQRRWMLDRSQAGDDQRLLSQLLVDAYLHQSIVQLSGPVQGVVGLIQKVGLGAVADGQAQSSTLRSPTGKSYRLIPTRDRGNFAHDRAELEAGGPNDGEHFAGKARKVAKTSASRAEVETFDSLDLLLSPLAADMDMRSKLSPNSRRIAEEDRNVTVRAFLYATKKETDNDFHLLLGTDPSGDNPRYMTAEISGLPVPDNAFTDVLRAARQQIKDFFRDSPLPGSSYVKFDPPVRYSSQARCFLTSITVPAMSGRGTFAPIRSGRFIQ